MYTPPTSSRTDSRGAVVGVIMQKLRLLRGTFCPAGTDQGRPEVRPLREMTTASLTTHPVGQPRSDKIKDTILQQTSTPREDVAQLNSFEEHLEQLDANPEWRKALRERILSEELVTLPAAFDGFAKSTANRMYRLEGDMGTIKGNQARADTIERANALAADLSVVHLRNLTRADLRGNPSVKRWESLTN